MNALKIRMPFAILYYEFNFFDELVSDHQMVASMKDQTLRGFLVTCAGHYTDKFYFIKVSYD